MATKRSKQQSKTERAQALVREQQRKERIRNITVIAGVVLVIVIIVGVGFFVQSRRDKTGQVATDVPSNLTGTYAVTVGQASAPTTIKLYEDFQCPICKEFEAFTGKQVDVAVAAGKVKVEYHMVAFLDASSSTRYSSRALNAAAAVLDTAGPQVFLTYHNLLYANQPAEGTAGLTDQQLIQYAVQAGADKSQVTPLIDNDTYQQWVLNATDQMSKDHVSGTPTVYINGKLQGGSPPNPQVAAEAVLTAVK
jgi:protein-disulfide isomerase